MTRETRLLLGVVLVSVTTLWVLARLRFPERPASPDPVGPVLAQFAQPSPFAVIATAVADLENRIGASLTRVSFTPRTSDPSARPVNRVAIRIAPEQAIVVLPSGDGPFDATPALKASSPRAALGLVPVRGGAPVAMAALTPSQAQPARFVIAVEGANDGMSFRPVFVGAFTPARAPSWPGVVWRVPATSALSDGALLFTDDGLFLGAVTLRGGARMLIPAATLAALGQQLADQPPRTPGWLGVSVQDLTAPVAVAVAAGASHAGVVVTHVEPDGPAHGLLQPFDVIDTAGGTAVATREQWESRVEQLDAGDTLELRVRRTGAEPAIVTVTAAAPAPEAHPSVLGADLRSRAGVGVEVLRVEPGGAAAQAGLREGDVITAAGTRHAPTAVQVRRAYAEGASGRPVALAVTRGTAHLVLALEKAE